MDFGQNSALIAEYAEDAGDFIERFEAMLLQIEESTGERPDSALVAEILSRLHTFKGNSGMMGYASLAEYAHRLEDVFKAAQSGAMVISEGLIENLLNGVRSLKTAIASLTVDTPAGPCMDGDIESLRLADEENAETPASSPRPAEQSVAALSTALLVKKTDVLKVDFKRLDHLLNLMGELVIQETRLKQLANKIKEKLGDAALVFELDESSEEIGKITDELHEVAMSVRMLPIRNVFRRFPRYARDLGKELGKEIDIELRGEGTEIDKTVMDEIGEPLLHILRNAIDHGIEKPAERTALGKPRRGKITISAMHESSHVAVTVEDDGRGIQKQAVEDRALKAGFSVQEGVSYKDLIFLPGLSTAETVTKVSGRGLGMDVVKNSLARLNGGIEVESEANVGTKFKIKLPLTLAIISALIVEVSREIYAIPLSAVQASFKVNKNNIHKVNHGEVISLRNTVLPLKRLADVFRLPDAAPRDDLFVVAVSNSFREVAIAVDALLGQQQIVIKPLDDYIGSSTGIAGSTILGDGRIVLVVDVPALMTGYQPAEQMSEAS